MRPRAFLAVAIVVAATAVPAAAADLTPLYSDAAWIVLGVEVKAIHQSPLGKKVFGQDGPAAAFRKLLAAFGNPEDADRLKALAALDPILDRLTRLTLITSEHDDGPDSDDFRVFLEGDFDDVSLGGAIEGACKGKDLPYKTETVRGRVVHIAEVEMSQLRVFRLDTNTVAVVFTSTALTDVLDRQGGRKKSKAPKAVVEGARAIDPTATPIWLVVGENREDKGMVYSRMVAAVALGADATLRVRMEAPDGAAADRCRKTLELFVNIFARIQDNRLLKGLGNSAQVETTATAVTATAVLSGRALAEEYSKQK